MLYILNYEINETFQHQDSERHKMQAGERLCQLFIIASQAVKVCRPGVTPLAVPDTTIVEFRPSESSIMYLFKEARWGTGEDWSEKVACELCHLLGLPHVHYDLAIWKHRRGVVCPMFVPGDGQLVHGNELLVHLLPGYPQQQLFGVSEHTLEHVFAILQDVEIQMPIGWTPFTGIDAAVDVFVGYLIQDAWIGNTDRHHENWGLVVHPQGTHLAPSYDHASSLGAHETDANRYDRLTTRDTGRSMQRYVERATSAFYASPADTRPMSTLSAFEEAGRRRPRAAQAWIARLECLSAQDIKAIFANIPSDRISAVAKDFAIRMLALNSQRLLTR